MSDDSPIQFPRERTVATHAPSMPDALDAPLPLRAPWELRALMPLITLIAAVCLVSWPLGTVAAVGATTLLTALAFAVAWRAVRVVGRMRLVDDGRRYVRVKTNIAGQLSRIPCLVTELSIGGAQLLVSGEAVPEPGHVNTLTFSVDSQELQFEAEVIEISEVESVVMVRVAFIHLVAHQRERLAYLLLTSHGVRREAVA